MKTSDSVLREILKPAVIVDVACVLIALWALRSLNETYGKELDYIEPI